MPALGTEIRASSKSLRRIAADVAKLPEQFARVGNHTGFQTSEAADCLFGQPTPALADLPSSPKLMMAEPVGGLRVTAITVWSFSVAPLTGAFENALELRKR
jgi:hypothetical protein